MSMNPQLEVQAQAKQSAIQQNYDAKKYICGGWLGATGGPWNLVFKPAWEEALRKQGDNFASYYDYLISETDHGGANGPAHPESFNDPHLSLQAVQTPVPLTWPLLCKILKSCGTISMTKAKKSSRRRRQR